MKQRHVPIAVVIALVLAACSSSTAASSTSLQQQDSTVATTIVPTTASTSTSTPDSTPTTPSTESPLTDEIVDVYFGIDDADCGAVAAYQRQVPAGVGVDQFAFEALLAGPNGGGPRGRRYLDVLQRDRGNGPVSDSHWRNVAR